MKNNVDKQYLKILKEILIENLKNETPFGQIKNKFINGDISVDKAYKKILKKTNNDISYALERSSKDRTNTGTYKSFGKQMVFDMDKGFPLLTTKKVYTRAIFEELIWFIKGDTSLRTLAKKNVKIWDEWPFQKYLEDNNLSNEIPKYTEKWISKKNEFIKNIKENEEFSKKYGDLGPIYGAQWRNFGGHDNFKVKIDRLLKSNPKFKKDFDKLTEKYDLPKFENNGVDQLKNLINDINKNPNSRRLLVFGYNPKEVHLQALPACHAFFQIYIKDGYISMSMYQRSADMFLGVPFNIASYAALLHMIAQVCKLKPGKLYHNLGDAHIYTNHLKQVQEQIGRRSHPLPNLYLNKSITKLENFSIDDIKIKNYVSETKIEAPVSV